MISTIVPLVSEQLANHPLRSVLVLFILTPITYLVANEYVRYTRRLKGFSGPRNWPLVGNIPDIKYNAADKYREWSKQYGAVYQIQLGNEPVVVVNSAEAARKIFGGNSQALSSRPVFWTFHKVLSNTAGTTIGTSPFNDSLKRRRKGAASALNKPSIATYIDHLDLETKDFIKDGFESGRAGTVGVDPMPMIERLSLSLSLTLNWGTRMGSRNDPMFHEITEVEAAISKFRSTTGNLQDYIPILRLNPFSGGTKMAKEYRSRRDVYLTKLNKDLDERMEKGTHKACIQANIIQDKEAALNKEELISISLTMLSGGLDTITTLVQWSVALLAQRPDIQNKAVAEIRKLYPDDQPLADAYDDQKCAYIVALVRECLRFYTVLRLALPRATVKDVMYEGKLIPAGSTIYLNAWACNMDPDVWTDAETFRPERWLEAPDAPLFTYGLGYRMCAGSLLANRELYLVFLRMLGSFEIVKDSEGGVVRGSMVGKSTYARRSIDEELGTGLRKKDDDHAFKPARRPNGNGSFPLRWRRKRVLLVVLGLVLLSVFMHYTGSSSGDKKSIHANPFSYTAPSRDPRHDAGPSWNEVREPTGAPPGMRAPRRGEATPHAFAGAFKFYRLARSLRGAAHTDGYRRVNRNVVFAMASLQSAATLIPLACEMARWNRNWVHAAFLGREDIPLDHVLAINGVDREACKVLWHDARPDYSEWSTDERAEASVQSALTHVYNFLHPQVAIVDDAASEDAFFTAGVRNRTAALGIPLIEVPQDKSEDYMWTTRLDAGSLSAWHFPTVDILVQVPPDSSSVLHLLKSIKDADYAGLGLPRITLDLPPSLDPTVQRALESFVWPPHAQPSSNQLVLRRRIAHHRASQESAAIAFLESFYPANRDAHALILSPAAQLSPLYFHYVKYALLEYRYSAYGLDDSSSIMGVSLELPPLLVDGKTALTLPGVKDMHGERYAKMGGDGDEGVMFAMQAPNARASLFFGDMWAEWHSFLSQRVSKHEHSVRTGKGASRAKLVSETQPSWAEYMLEMMRARGYSLLYPAPTRKQALISVHNEMHRAPDEFATPDNTDTTDAQAPTPEDLDAPFLRAASSPAPPATLPEPPLLRHSQPLHSILPFDGDLPEVQHVPQLLYNGAKLDPSSIAVVAAKYRRDFAESVGGCKIPTGKRRKRVPGSAADLFCFGDEGEEEWEVDWAGAGGAAAVGNGPVAPAGADGVTATMMLARAAARTLRRDAFRPPTQLSGQLRQLRRSSNVPTVGSMTAAAHDSRRTRRPSLSSRHDTRSLATAAELHPNPHTAPLDGFMQAWGARVPSPELSRLQPVDATNPLVVHDQYSHSTPQTRATGSGISGDPVEMHQNLYACLRVGRTDRAAMILKRLATIYTPAAPEMTDAHNIFLQTLLELAQEDPRPDAMQSLEDWYNKNMVAKHVPPNAATFVTLLRAACSFLEGDKQEHAVRAYLDMANECGPDVLEQVNTSPDLSDDEWNTIIRLQPDSFEEPPPADELHHLQFNTPESIKTALDAGLPLQAAQIKPVEQKGFGLSTLQDALSVFTDTTLPYPHDMEGTQAEKDRAYNYARQIQMEKDGMDAAIQRWRQEDEKLTEMGIHGVLKTKSLQALMFNWYTALIPMFKKQIAHAQQVISNPTKDNANDDAHSYGAWLEKCEPERLAANAITRVVHACVQRSGQDSDTMKLSALSVAIGNDVMEHINQDAQARHEKFLKTQRRNARRELVEKLSKARETTGSTEKMKIERPKKIVEVPYEKTEIPLTVRVKIGALCLENVLQAARITVTATDPKTGRQLTSTQAAFHHQMVLHQGKKVGWVVPHHEIMTKLRNEPVHNIVSVRLPMVVPPKPWSSFDNGGYYTMSTKVVRQKAGDQSQKAYASTAIDNGDMKQVLAGLDVLGKVPWQINKPVFDVMAEVWNSGEALAGIVPEKVDMERPADPPADADFIARTAWGKKLKEYENYKSGLHAQRCFQNFQLEVASAMANEKEMYFPHSVDFRGRAYPIPPILNHIGSDVARGLLKFANGKELGSVGLQWLKVHLANLAGFDKASLRDREQFAMDNMNEIIDSATNPLGGRRWWAKAEDPWQCLACCMELKNAFDLPDPTRYVSQLPVHQDGTCNGLQHYAALGGDQAGARQVNLEPSDRPQDIYTGVAELVKEMVDIEAEQGVVAAKFIQGHISRKVVKRTVMTNVYGVTFMGAKQQVHDELKHMFPNFKETKELRSLIAVAMYVAYKIFEALGKIFNGAQEIQYWLGECGDRITTSITAEQVQQIKRAFEGKAPTVQKKYRAEKISKSSAKGLQKAAEVFKTGIIWTTPLKMPIVQPYRKDSVTTIRTPLQDITVQKRAASDIVDKRKQLQAFPPNFIHSLDASHMLLSALKCDEMGLDFAAVHDSFWTHACDIPNLNVILRDAFVRMHSEDITKRLAAEFGARYADNMYRANIHQGTVVGREIQAWRLANKTKKTDGSGIGAKYANASFDEVALEAQRQELLKSEDPKLRAKGEAMVTPTSIWLKYKDPKTIASYRLSLLGDTAEKTKDNAPSKADEIMQKNKELEEEVMKAKDPSVITPETEDSSAHFETPKTERKGKWLSEMSTVQVWLPLTFPPVPKKGDWDVARLRESKYFFS
ncbi:DNA-directed RNA polymerase [Didymella heteroderae]|uniref:DNA-directed RNA polymerase n=1 Tax=Didymella heteroderae TaxID=1769908 RepID=A0A9P5BWG4_9PLEO|nr:DNA-directed RNA polymerase [Didymella heteroderae]